MLYEISMFWDGRHCDTKAEAESCEDKSNHWVRVTGSDAAKTTIFVPSADCAERLSALINEIIFTTDKKQAA